MLRDRLPSVHGLQVQTTFSPCSTSVHTESPPAVSVVVIQPTPTPTPSPLPQANAMDRFVWVTAETQTEAAQAVAVAAQTDRASVRETADSGVQTSRDEGKRYCALRRKVECTERAIMGRDDVDALALCERMERQAAADAEERARAERQVEERQRMERQAAADMEERAHTERQAAAEWTAKEALRKQEMEDYVRKREEAAAVVKQLEDAVARRQAAEAAAKQAEDLRELREQESIVSARLLEAKELLFQDNCKRRETEIATKERALCAWEDELRQKEGMLLDREEQAEQV